MKRFSHLAAGLCAGLLLAACGSGAGASATADGPPRSGGDLTVVISGRTWSHLDIAVPAVTPFKGLLNAIYEPLLRLAPDGEIEPWLAESYEVSPDRLAWTFHLQDGVTFHDGTPFDSAAVQFNLMRQVDPAQRAGEGGNLPQDITVETPDPLTAVVHLSEPDEALGYAIATSAVGLMASPAAVERWGKEFGLHPVGTGPFRLESQVIGQSARLPKWEGYWREGEPRLDSVTFQVLGSGASALQTLRSGQAQVMDFVQPLEAKAAGADPSLALVQAPATTVNEYIFNTTRAPFGDIRARRAVGHAINQQALSDTLFFGKSKPVQSAMASGSWAYPGPQVEDYPAYDPGKAASLVQELGGLTFTLTVSNTPYFLEQAAAVQAQLAQAGITMNIEPTEPSKKIADCFSRNYDACQFIVPGLPDPDGYARPFFDSTAGSNPSGLENAELNALFAAGRTTADREERKKIYVQMAQRMAQLVPAIYLAEVPPTRLQSTKVKDIPALPIDAYYLNAAWLAR